MVDAAHSKCVVLAGVGVRLPSRALPAYTCAPRFSPRVAASTPAIAIPIQCSVPTCIPCPDEVRAVSTEAVLKVVNPPQKPVPNGPLRCCENPIWLSATAVINPNTSDPATLMTKVPTGTGAGNRELIRESSRKRATAPRPPARHTHIIIMTTFCQPQHALQQSWPMPAMHLPRRSSRGR